MPATQREIESAKKEALAAMATGVTECKYSCENAAQTLQWIHAIIDFLRPYSFLMNAHVVNFFQDRLWEAVDKEWIECLRKEPVENLLRIPSGVVQEHWPASLKKFVTTLRSLVFPREQTDLNTVLPGLNMASLNSVLTQGMNSKKNHEVEVLSAVVSLVTNSVGALKVLDIGAGQGYLAQVLSFLYQHSVVAIDASSHHGRVTDARAGRIMKHYASQMRKSESGKKSMIVPKTITSHVMSIDALKALTYAAMHESNASELDQGAKFQQSSCIAENESSIVLAGLHACGDLSVMMLKTFLECKEVKAVVSIGCCYNLLSEEGLTLSGSESGFPVSSGVKSAEFPLGKSLRDLACQSAERWKNLENNDGLHNFELHYFRAAFQMVLRQYYPDIMTSSPSIGRQGKAFRRQQQKGNNNSLLCNKGSTCFSLSQIQSNVCSSKQRNMEDGFETSALCHANYHSGPVDKFSLFERYSQTGLQRLGLELSQDINFHVIWKEVEPFADLIGPYWSLRAALGPVLETFILLDRLLFLQEQGNLIEALMLPIFDPILSPRNVAIIAKKK